MLIWHGLVVITALIWLMILLLPWQPWRTRERLEASTSTDRLDLSRVTVVIPARNEAACITTTLQALQAQGDHLTIILVDDRSDDATVALAERLVDEHLHIVPGKPLPAGWTGKLWAQAQGVERVETNLTLLLDADIELVPGMLAALLRKKDSENLQFISLMAALGQHGWWEKWFMPAFIHFFKMLYPFALANRPGSRVAAAAGGCILLETRLFDAIGGLTTIRGAIIDDCTLAQRVKSAGYRTWLGLTHGVRSQRSSQSLNDIWNMVARTAFTQLRYSLSLLLICTALMLLLYWLPLLSLWSEVIWVRWFAAFGFGAMLVSYWPTVRFYRRQPAWLVTMPVLAGVYLAMTWGSALRYWRGEKSRWKGRVYPT